MKNNGSILIVDDNKEYLEALSLILTDHNFRVDSSNRPETITKQIADQQYDVILLDMNFDAGVPSGNEGLFWMNKICKIQPSVTIVFITAFGDVELAVRSLKEGATDFIQKSWSEEKILSTISSAINLSKSKREAISLKNKQLHLTQTLDEYFPMCKGSSILMSKIFETIEKVAPTEANILILGENGTGKELIAREIHRFSKRANEIFVKVDVGSIAPTLFESELFGHVKGAFTDARQNRAGRFEVASGGTLFLDEIGNLTLELQTKILSAVQNKTIVRLGSNMETPIDIRLICATNMPIYKMTDEQKFREDLLYRINTIQIDIPPLRERPEDIAELIGFFATKYADKYGKAVKGFSKMSLEKLKKQSWYGNVRELEHVIEKAIIMSDNEIIKPDDISFFSRSGRSLDKIESFKLEDNEKSVIAKALKQFNWNMTHTAEALGINRSTLYDKIKKYEL